MRNKRIKTTLLLIAAIGILVGIFQYSDSVLTAPQEVKYTNKHIQDIDEMISTIPSTRLNDDTPSLLLNIVDKIELCQREKFITSNERDELFEKLIARYVPAFIASCRATFGQSVWHTSHLERIKSQIDHLFGLTIQKGTRKLINGSYLADMNEVKYVIDKYNEAKAFLADLQYVSIDESKKQMAQAESFKTCKYIKNCTELVDELDAVGKRLNDLHYAYLEKETQKLNNYKYMTEEEFKRTDEYVNDLFASYRNNAMKIYSTITYMASLDDTHMRIYYIGIRYYEQQHSKASETNQRRSRSTDRYTSSHSSTTHSSTVNTNRSSTSPSRSYEYNQYRLAISDYVKSQSNRSYNYKDIEYGKQKIFSDGKFESQFDKEMRQFYNKNTFNEIRQFAKENDIFFYVPFSVAFRTSRSKGWARYSYIAFFNSSNHIIRVFSYTPAL